VPDAPLPPYLERSTTRLKIRCERIGVFHSPAEYLHGIPDAAIDCFVLLERAHD